MSNNGRLFENEISKKLLKINKKEHGFFIKSPTPMKMVPIDGKIVPIYANKALCDFIGIYNSKFILIETKNLSTKRFEFKRLASHQEKQLAAIKRHGGISIILIKISDSNEIIALGINDYLVYKSQTDKKSINVNTLKEIGKIISINDIEEYIDSL